MKQSRKASLAESITSTAVGFGVSLAILEGVNQVWDLSLGWDDNLVITGIFTAASVLRSYLVRRGFNWFQHRNDEDEELKAQLFAQFEAQANAAKSDQYVRVPDGMSIGEAILKLTPTGPLWNNPADVYDILNEENAVKPVK